MIKFVLVSIKTKGPIKTDLSYISGSSIRGTYINLYIKKNNIKEDISLNKVYRRKLLSNSIRFFDAYPKMDGNYSIPTPLCFHATKNDIKKFSRDKKPIEIKNEFKDDIAQGYQRVNKSEFSIIKDKKLNLISIKKVENLHNCKQINGENLFRYEAIDKNQEFYTIIQCDDDLADEVKDCIDNQVLYIGGSKSSGYGRCEVKVDGIFDYKQIKSKYNISLDNNDEKLNIFFMSDTIIKDEFGNLQSTIPDKLLEDNLGIKITRSKQKEDNEELYKASIISKDVKGYNAMWKCKVSSETAIKAGSIITYTYKGMLDKNKIEQFEIKGIGSKKNEGYGRILINPKFDVKKCAIYEEKEIERKRVDLSNNSKEIMKIILDNIAKEREEQYLLNIIIDTLDNFDENSKRRKIKLNYPNSNKKDFPNTQKAKIINLIDEALIEFEKSGEDKSKQKIIKFISELKSNTQKMYQSRDKYSLFNLSIEEYLKGITENKLNCIDIEKIQYPQVEGIDFYKSSQYEMYLKLTKSIMEYKIREKGGIK